VRSVLAIAAAATLALVGACGGGNKAGDTTPDPPAAPDGGPATTDTPPNDSPEQLDYEEVELGNRADVIPLMKVGAEGIGCSLVAEEANGIAYQCDHGTIFLVQVGTVLRYTCQHIEKAQCAALLDRINQKVLEAAGGGE